MEIQIRKEGMKTKQFNKEVGATTGCTLRLILNKILPQLATVKHGVHGDAWFGTKWDYKAMKASSKLNNIIFLKDFIEEALKEAPGGVHIALEGTTEDEVPLVALGYRYSRKTVLHFILTKNVGSSKPGTLCQMTHQHIR